MGLIIDGMLGANLSREWLMLLWKIPLLRRKWVGRRDVLGSTKPQKAVCYFFRISSES
jgi:hypothetical protein